MSTAKARTAHARAILGPELHDQLSSTRVLLVGAGGIGCELRESILFLEWFHLLTSGFSEEYRLDGLWRNHAFGSRHHRPVKPE